MARPIEIVKNDQQKIVIAVKEYEGRRYIDIRTWTRDDPRYVASEDAEGNPIPLEWKPSHKGITVPLAKAGELRAAIDRLFAENEFKKEEI